MLREVFPPQAELYIVGGAVRDALLGAPSEDLDFATDLGAEEVMMYLSARGIRTVPTGMRHGTVTAVLPSGLNTNSVPQPAHVVSETRMLVP